MPACLNTKTEIFGTSNNNDNDHNYHIARGSDTIYCCVDTPRRKCFKFYLRIISPKYCLLLEAKHIIAGPKASYFQ